MCLYFLPKRLPKKFMKIRSSLIWRHGKKCKLSVTIRAYWGVFFYIAILNLWSTCENTCDGVQFLVKFASKYLTSDAEELYFITSFCWTTTFMEHLLKVAFMFQKSEGNSRETSRIIRQVPSSSLKETSTGRLIFWRNKETKRLILVWQIAVKEKKWIANAHWWSWK